MGTTAPLAIGTRGTVGSLVRREIEYFRRLELDRGETSKKVESKNYVGISNNTSKTSYSTSRTKVATLGSLLTISWRRKKRRNNSSSNNSNSTFLPSMCSAVDVSESKRFGGLNYRNLKADIEP
ncbi:Epoxide hydrolase 2 [Bienertia sinuspersici]